ncbi:MAG: hypothetical protein ACI942_000946 [Planctomycetota bacterium]|jgi:hypothetical protein
MPAGIPVGYFKKYHEKNFLSRFDLCYSDKN